MSPKVKKSRSTSTLRVRLFDFEELSSMLLSSKNQLYSSFFLTSPAKLPKLETSTSFIIKIPRLDTAIEILKSTVCVSARVPRHIQTNGAGSIHVLITRRVFEHTGIAGIKLGEDLYKITLNTESSSCKDTLTRLSGLDPRSFTDVELHIFSSRVPPNCTGVDFETQEMSALYSTLTSVVTPDFSVIVEKRNSFEILSATYSWLGLTMLRHMENDNPFFQRICSLFPARDMATIYRVMLNSPQDYSSLTNTITACVYVVIPLPF